MTEFHPVLATLLTQDASGTSKLILVGCCIIMFVWFDLLSHVSPPPVLFHTAILLLSYLFGIE